MSQRGQRICRATRYPGICGDFVRFSGGLCLGLSSLVLSSLVSCASGYVYAWRETFRYRNTHGVGLEEHYALLKQRGWTSEEYEAGFRQGVAPREGSEHFIQYEALVRRELASGEVRQVAERRRNEPEFFFFFFWRDERVLGQARLCLLQLMRPVTETVPSLNTPCLLRMTGTYAVLLWK